MIFECDMCGSPMSQHVVGDSLELDCDQCPQRFTFHRSVGTYETSRATLYPSGHRAGRRARYRVADHFRRVRAILFGAKVVLGELDGESRTAYDRNTEKMVGEYLKETKPRWWQIVRLMN